MKKIISLFLVAIMSLSLVACGTKEPTNDNDVKQETEQITEPNTDQVESESIEDTDTNEAETSTSEENTEPEKPEILTAFDGKSPKIPSADFPNYLEVVEITADNWKDYFEVVYDEEWESYYLSCKAPIYDLTNLTLELKVIKEDSPIKGEVIEIEAFSGNTLLTSNDVGEEAECTIDDFECVTAQGELIVGNIPEELWGINGDTPVVYVGSNSGEQWMTIGRETSLGKFLD